MNEDNELELHAERTRWNWPEAFGFMSFMAFLAFVAWLILR